VLKGLERLPLEYRQLPPEEGRERAQQLRLQAGTGDGCQTVALCLGVEVAEHLCMVKVESAAEADGGGKGVG